MVSPGLAQLIRGEVGDEILPEILAFLTVPAIVALCCTSVASRKVAYSCRRLLMSSTDEQGVNLVGKSSRTLKTLLITSTGRVVCTAGRKKLQHQIPVPEELMTRVFATVRAGVLRYLEELTIHVSLRAPWSSIVRNLFHDAVKLGSVGRLKRLDFRLDMDHLDSSTHEDDLLNDIAKHCPDLRTVRLAPSSVWSRSSQAKADFIALMTHPCWPKLEHLDLESYAAVHNFMFAQPEVLATALTKTRFPSLVSIAFTLPEAMLADHYIWDVVTHPHASVMPRVRELRFTTAPPVTPVPPAVPSYGVWSQDSYSLPTQQQQQSSRPQTQQKQQQQGRASDSMSQNAQDNIDAIAKAMLERLRGLQFSSLQSVRLPEDGGVFNQAAANVFDRMNARFHHEQALS